MKSRKGIFTLMQVLLVAVLFTACEKDDPTPQTSGGTLPASCTPTTGNRVLILNEGGFGAGNGSLSIYKSDEMSLTSDVFSCVNSNLPLGDIPQSITEHNGNYYVVVNNSAKIEVLNASTFEREATISGLVSPRFVQVVDANKAYISDLFGGAINILDLNSNQITGSIPSAGWSERMLLHNGVVYVLKPSSYHMMMIDPTTDAIIDSINIGLGAATMQLDANNHLWVLCDGGYQTDIPSLFKLDPVTSGVLTSFNFTSALESPSKLLVDANGSKLYFNNNGIFEMDITDVALPTTTWADAQGHSFYSMDIDPNNGDLYAGDAKDFVGTGEVLRYNSNGAIMDSFETGIIPSFFYFE